MHNKLLITGRWVITKDDTWRLAIDPFIEVYNIDAQQLKTISAFSIVDVEKMDATRKFNKHQVTVSDFDAERPRLTMINLGDFHDSEGFPFQFYLLLEPMDVADNQLVSRYEVYVDEITLDEDEDELDHAIVKALSRFRTPSKVTCNPTNRLSAAA